MKLLLMCTVGGYDDDTIDTVISNPFISLEVLDKFTPCCTSVSKIHFRKYLIVINMMKYPDLDTGLAKNCHFCLFIVIHGVFPIGFPENVLYHDIQYLVIVLLKMTYTEIEGFIHITHNIMQYTI